MKPKDYDRKRRALRDEKREGMKEDFVDTKARKKFVDGIKRSYRSLKRSERQVIDKEIEDAIYNEDDF